MSSSRHTDSTDSLDYLLPSSKHTDSTGSFDHLLPSSRHTNLSSCTASESTVSGLSVLAWSSRFLQLKKNFLNSLLIVLWSNVPLCFTQQMVLVASTCWIVEFGSLSKSTLGCVTRWVKSEKWSDWTLKKKIYSWHIEAFHCALEIKSIPWTVIGRWPSLNT